MFLLRSATHADLEALYELSSLATLMNLPNDRTRLLERIETSMRSFSGELSDPRHTFFTFLLENPKGEVIGTSGIVGQTGTREDPHISFEVFHVEKYSPTLDQLFKHTALRLSFNYEGPSEIASIIMRPKFRGMGKKLGSQLSFVRFLYMATRPERFRKTVIAEMLPPHVSDGWSPLWNALGAKFTGLNYVEADRLSRENKNFIERLFPHSTIYVTLLPADAQEMVGAVDEQTEPAVRMLKSVGFNYHRRIDPFDGGPHYVVKRDKIRIVKDAFGSRLQSGDPEGAPLHLVGCESDDGAFRAVLVNARLDGDSLVVAPEAIARLGVENEAAVTASPIGGRS